MSCPPHLPMAPPTLSCLLFASGLSKGNRLNEACLGFHFLGLLSGTIPAPALLHLGEGNMRTPRWPLTEIYFLLENKKRIFPSEATDYR